MWPFTHKLTVAESGVLSGYVEMHCHLLPGVDDGVQEMDESLAVLQLLESQGVGEVWLTPHVMEDIPNTPEHLKEVFATLQSQLSSARTTELISNRQLSINLAAEYMLDANFEKILRSGDLLPHRDGMLLVETSYFNPPYDLDGMLDEVRRKGFFPLLAHPERYVYMDDEDYERLHDLGIRFQLNLPSLTGHYGSTAQKKAQSLLKKGWYYTCGTDTHSLRSIQHFLHSKLSSKVIEKVIATGAHTRLSH